MKLARKTLLSALLLASLSGTAQQLASQYHIKSASTSYHRMATDGSGNVYVYGAFDDLDGKNLGRLLKLDPLGNPIPGFHKIYGDGVITDLLIQDDHKILISGTFKEINGEPVSPILRLNTDGSIDETFSCPLTNPGDMELQTTGKIIVLINGVFERLNSDGSIDQSFNFQNFVSSFAEFEIAPDNSIYFSNFNIVHKLTSEGVDDNSFQLGAGADQSYISALAVQADGKVVVGGFFNSYNGVASKSIIRLNNNGLVDGSFVAGNNITGQLFQIAQRSNGNLLIGGQFYQYAGQPASLVELKTDGTLFRNIAVVHINNITTIFEGPDTKITIAGEFNQVNGISVFGTCRFNANYTMDRSFSPKITYNNSNGLHVIVDNAMKATMLGDYQMYGIYNGSSIVEGKVLRANALGAYDSKFTPKFVNANVYAGHIQADGKVIVCGGFGGPNWEVLRLNADGSKDGSFNVGTGATTNGISTVAYAIEEIGNLIFLGGSFSHFNGVASHSLVAVNTDGSVAKSFSSLPLGSQVNKIVAQSDGKVILTGYFTFPSETFYVVRLNSDGSLDDSFHRPTLLQPPSDIEVDQSGNIYLSGESLHPDGSLLKSVVKLTPNGFVDGLFSIGSGFAPWGYVTAIEVLPDGRIAVGGHFDLVQGVEQPGFAILSQSGELVPQQETFFGKGSAAVDIFLKNGQLFLAGKFRTRDYNEAYAFVKVLPEDAVLPSPPSNLSVSLTNPGALSVSWTANSSDQLAFVVERAVDNLENFAVVDTVEANVNQYTDNIVRNHFHAYRVRAINDVGYSGYSNIDSLKWAPVPQGALTLNASIPTSPQVTLSWQGAVLYHNGFIIEYTSGNNSAYTTLDTLSESSSTFTHAIDRNVKYQYRVKAYNEAGALSSGTVLVEWLPLPEGTLNLTVTTPSAGETVLSWTNSISNNDGFIIERSSQPEAGFVHIDTVATTASTFTDVTDGKKSYYYRILAYNANGTIKSNTGSMIITGIERVSENGISIYPNPAKEYVSVTAADQAAFTSVTIVDRDGRVLFQADHLSRGTHGLDLTGLAPGVYLVKATTIDRKHLTKRIVKE